MRTSTYLFGPAHDHELIELGPLEATGPHGDLTAVIYALPSRVRSEPYRRDTGKRALALTAGAGGNDQRLPSNLTVN